MRALLLALTEWVVSGKAPPPSRYPRIADGTLVNYEIWKGHFPQIPGCNLPGSQFLPPRLDFGSRFLTEGIADIIPPKVGEPYRTRVPDVDGDGNETSGIRLPEVAVPLGTYTGWNLRAPATGAETMMSSFEGMFLPFAPTQAARLKNGDPRQSLEERYPTRAVYFSRLTDSALKLHDEGFLLDEDVVRILERGARVELPR